MATLDGAGASNPRDGAALYHDVILVGLVLKKSSSV